MSLHHHTKEEKQKMNGIERNISIDGHTNKLSLRLWEKILKLYILIGICLWGNSVLVFALNSKLSFTRIAKKLRMNLHEEARSRKKVFRCLDCLSLFWDLKTNMKLVLTNCKRFFLLRRVIWVEKFNNYEFSSSIFVEDFKVFYSWG